MRIRVLSLVGRFCPTLAPWSAFDTHFRRLGLSFASGLCIALASPAVGSPFVGYFALVPLGLAVLVGTRARGAALAGLVAYGIAALVCLDFMRDVLVSGAGISRPLSASAIALVSLGFAARGVVFALLLSRLVKRGFSAGLSLLLALVTSELVPAPVPWTLGALLLDASWWPIASWLGSTGVTLVLGVCCAAIVTLLTEGARRALPWFVALASFQVVSLLPTSTIDTRTLAVGIVATDVDRGARLSLSDIARRAAALERDGAKLVVFPESALRGTWTEDDLATTLGLALHEVKVPILLGVVIRTDDARPEKLWNSAVWVAPNEPLHRYDKRRLVPLSEGSSGLLGAISRRFGFTTLGTFEEGTRADPLSVNGERIFPSVCFEGLFGDLFRETESSPGMFVNLVNDGWFDARGDRLHARLTRLRAVESGRALVRVANDGESYVVDARGHTLAAATGDADFVTNVPLYTGRTLYSRVGDAWVYLIGAATLGLALTMRKADAVRGSSAPS